MLWISLALATEPASDWEIVKESQDCSFARGPQAELVASCVWPEVELERLDEVLSDFGAAEEVWASVTSSAVQGQPGPEGTKVFHVHAIPGLSDREVLLLWQRVEEEGALRFSWSRPEEQPKPAQGRVNVPRDEGYYLLRGATGGGVQLEAKFVYDPGGSVPDWVLRVTQVASSELMLEELRAAAKREEEE